MDCLEGLEEVPVELEEELQLAVALFVVAVLLAVPEEDRAVRAEEAREEEEPEDEVVVERTKQHPPPPLWTQKWINTTRTEPRRKLI